MEHYTSYTTALYESLKQTTWTPTNDGYMTSKKFGSLHSHVMAVKYGKDVIKEAYANNFVIDHINNEGLDCSYTNLEIIPRKLNAAKGLTYDEEREKLKYRFAINFSKDEATNEFQISVGFNKPHNLISQEGDFPVAALYFKYGTDYKTTFLDAQTILNDLEQKERLELDNLRAKTILIKKAIKMFISKDEAKFGYIVRDGRVYFIQGSEHLMLEQLGHKKELHQD